VADTGWTWAEVGRLTVPRYEALYRAFRRHPPVAWMVASYLGVKTEDEGGPVMNAEDFAAFIQATGGRLPGMMPG